MISKKVFTADGVNRRFLLEFIAQSEQFARPYAYIYDNTLDPNGTEDVLQNPVNPWSFPDNLYRRGTDAPKIDEDLLTVDKWDLVDNSILTYDIPLAPTHIWIEVATTSEEFGDTLTAPSVERAETAADLAVASVDAAAVSETNAATSASNASTSETNAAASESAAALSETNSAASALASATSASEALASENAAALSETNAGTSETNAAASEASASASASAASLSETNAGGSETSAELDAWISEAEAMTSDAYAVTPENTFVTEYTSNGDGTFTGTVTANYSSLHWSVKAQGFGGGSTPIGGIIMYDGLVVNIPANWALCDGTNGTPNLVDQFIFGTATELDIGTTGGSADAIIPSHSHTANHNHTASSNTTGNHTHTSTAGGTLATGSTNDYGSSSATNYGTTVTNAAGNHSHTITVNTNNFSTSTEGVSVTNANIPPYVKLAYIKRTS